MNEHFVQKFNTTAPGWTITITKLLANYHADSTIPAIALEEERKASY